MDLAVFMKQALIHLLGPQHNLQWCTGATSNGLWILRLSQIQSQSHEYVVLVSKLDVDKMLLRNGFM